MKKKYIAIILPLVAFVLYTTLSSSTGGVDNVYSAALGGCSCHDPSPSASTVVTLSGLPAAGYTNGTIYSLTLTITNTSITGPQLRDGFDLASTAGTFAAISGTQLGGSNSEILHTTPKNAVAGVASWTFNWTAPASGSATVTFNAACNATNGDGNASAPDAWNFFSTTLVKSTALAVTATSTSITCNGGTSTITATGSNGTLPYQYKLNAGVYQSTNTFAGNPSGIYTITVKDATNATATALRTITQPSLVTFGTPTLTSPLCNGGNGSISILATGGTGSTKTYTITPVGPQSNTTGSFTALPAQNYTVTARDANSCSRTTAITLTQPTLLSFATPTINNPACNGGTGSVSVVASGGTGTKTYTITPLGPQSNTTGLFTSLTPQAYTITVTDANACTKSTVVTLTQPTLLSFGVPVIANPLCNGGAGNITVTASGGTGTKTYTITPLGPQSNTTGNFTGLSAQGYTITATDANNCTKTTTISLTQPTALSIAPPTITNALCFGGTGSASILASGGTGAYTYFWSNSTIDSVDIVSNKDNTIFQQNQNNSDGAGPYMYAGKLNNGFVNRALMQFDLSSVPLGASVTGATLFLNCSNTNGASGAQQIDLHKVTQDWGEGTSNSGAPGGIGAPATLNDATWAFRMFPSTPWSNAGGSFNASASGSTMVNGVGPYSWSSAGLAADVQAWLNNSSTNFGWLLKGTESGNGQAKRFDTKEGGSPENAPLLRIYYTLTPSSSSQSGLSAGVYTVTVSDANNCSLTTSVTITEPNQLIVTASNVSGCTGSPIALLGTPSGGVFSVANPYTGPSATYTYTYTDGNGCIETSAPATITVTPCGGTTLNLKLFFEGCYLGSSTMAPTLMNEGVGLSATETDTILVELRNAVTYATEASVTTILQTDGTATCNLGSVSGSYYIAVKHRNTVQTWSADPVTLNTGVNSYDFTTGSGKAYGNNMKEVETNVWAFFTGDINQDENADLLDLSQLENDINSFQFGYYGTDLNGDGNVDLLDSPTLETNINQFVFSNHP